MISKKTQLLASIISLVALAGLSTVACSDAATLEDGTEEVTDSSDAADASDATETDASDPEEPISDIIQPTKEFPGQLTDWCTGQPDNFSFFVTSMDAIWKISDSVPDDWNGGFGGDFQGLEGADSICQIIAIATGHGNKRWRAMLSATNDGNGNPVHAIDRIGQGPWYDANGRLVANNIEGLMSQRPDGKFVVIDMSVNGEGEWKKWDKSSFFGANFIWTTLHDFGGTGKSVIQYEVPCAIQHAYSSDI